MAALPVLKLSGLFIKTIAKPLTSYMKKEAPKKPLFSKFCIGIGQGVHTLFSRINVLASGYKFVGVKPLAADEALSKGVEYLSEFLVISASGAIIMIEFTRSEKKNALKAAAAAKKEARLELALQTRLACIEAGLVGLEAVLDKKAAAKLVEWRSTELDSTVQGILKMNNVKLQAAEQAEKDIQNSGSSDEAGGVKSSNVEGLFGTVDYAVGQVLGAAQSLWGLTSGVWAETVGSITGTEEGAAKGTEAADKATAPACTPATTTATTTTVAEAKPTTVDTSPKR